MTEVSASRKWAGRGIQLLLVLAVLAYIGNHMRLSFMGGMNRQHVSALAAVPDSLGPGDLRIYNADSSVDLVLWGDKLAAGLSPKTVARVRHDMDTSAHADTGLGGSIAQIVKKSVAGAIGTHAIFQLADLRDIRYEGDHFVFDWKSGGHRSIFQNTTVNGKRADETFSQQDAERFIAAVHARQQTLHLP